MKFFGFNLRAFALLCAAALPLLAACQSDEPRQSAGRQAVPLTPAAPEAHILVDEAMLQKPHAILGGTVENVGGEPLENLSVELELRRRGDGAVELRQVPVVPSALSPGEKGRYSLKVLSQEWSGSRLLRLRSSSREADIVFRTSPGARRPPERIPVGRLADGSKPPARPRPNGEEFINTPDTATSVP